MLKDFTMPFTYISLYFIICWIGPKISEAAEPTFLYHNCTNTTTFAPNSVYKTNLNLLLSFLVSNSTREFHYATVGDTQDPSDSVHGLFLCRGDIDPTACRDCVATATKDALDKCPVEKQNVMWYDECQLRYSNRSFFGTVDFWPGIALINTANITDPVRFDRMVNATLKAASDDAANRGQKKFATIGTYITIYQRVYCLVQCTPDLSAADCGLCLANATERLHRFSDKQGARVLYPSCSVRYELYPFYDQSTSPYDQPTPPSTPPSPPSLPPSAQPTPSSPPPGFVAMPEGTYSRWSPLHAVLLTILLIIVDLLFLFWH